MIVTGDNIVNKLNTDEHWMYLTNDVNTKNIDFLRQAYNKCDLYIDNKFEMPGPSNNVFIVAHKSKTVQSLTEFASEERRKVLEHTNKILMNETQYNNFIQKLNFWCAEQFSKVIEKNDEHETPLVFIHNNVSKHEWLLITWLYKLGVNFVIIGEKANSLDTSSLDSDITLDICGSAEGLDYKVEEQTGVTVRIENKQTNNSLALYKDIESIEKAIYEENKLIQLIINGTENFGDTKNFYAKLYNKCVNSSDWRLYIDKFDKPTNNEISAIPRLRIDRADYIITTLLQFVKVNGRYDVNSLKDAIKQEFSLGENKGLNGTILYNRLVYIICSINNILKQDLKGIVFYGAPDRNDAITLSILSTISDMCIIVLNSDKSKIFEIDGVNKLELKNSTPYFDIPTVDSRDNASTMAAKAQNIVDKTLFSGDTLGMYKPGQFRTAITKRFSTTYDEIELWWNKDLYLRPSFEARGDTAIIPTMFKVIRGVNCDSREYVDNINKLIAGQQTCIFKSKEDISLMFLMQEPAVTMLHNTDVNGTMFSEQKPFYESGRLVTNRIKSDKNYQYSFLSDNKQDTILANIENIINTEYFTQDTLNDYFEGTLHTKYSKENYIDFVLNTLLNIGHIGILRYIQWFEYYTYNPNIIVILSDENKIDLRDSLILLFLSLMGFDVLIYVPTTYTSVEKYYTEKFQYDNHFIGEAQYDMNLSDIGNISAIPVTNNNTKKKQGFFSKLFK